MAILSKMTDKPGIFPIRDVRVIDGDAIEAIIVLPFDALVQKRIRLRGWWADELDGPHAEAGQRAKSRLAAFVAANPLWIECPAQRLDKYGRVLAALISSGGPVDARAVLGDCQLTEREHKARRDALVKAQVEKARALKGQPYEKIMGHGGGMYPAP
jgi:endonuclease YncB( thermonuclease family)